MKFYNENKQMYLETDVLGISLVAGLLQARDGIQLPRDEAPDNSAL